MKTISLIILILAASISNVIAAKQVSRLKLGETEITINIYHNPAASITFFAPHYNEQIGAKLAAEFVARKGGRFIEIESFNELGSPSRNIRFTKNGKNYSVDPNRIFTENGRICALPVEIRPDIEKFADEVLALIFAGKMDEFRDSKQPLVAVHNNADSESKTTGRRNDLTALSFSEAISSHTAFHAQSAGVFLANKEKDADNFIFLSDHKLLSHFTEAGFNVVVQKEKELLSSKQCSVDDGSLSVFAGKNALSYICLEADALSGDLRQRQMFATVYQLLEQGR